MKAKLNITIEESVLAEIKSFAVKQKISLSEIVESYFMQLTKPQKKKSLITAVRELHKPDIDENADLVDLYYQSKI